MLCVSKNSYFFWKVQKLFMQISKKVVCMHTLWYGPDMTTICEASHNLESYVYTKNCTYVCSGKVFQKIRKGQKTFSQNLWLLWVALLWHLLEVFEGDMKLHTTYLGFVARDRFRWIKLRSFRKRNTLLDKTPTFYGRVTIYFGKTKNKNFVVRSPNL